MPAIRTITAGNAHVLLRVPRNLRAVALLVLAVLCVACAGGTDAREHLLEMQAALIETPAVEYKFEFRTLENGEAAGGVVAGSAALLRLDLSGGQYVARIQLEDHRTQPPGRFSGVKTRDDVYFADDSTRIVQEASLYSAGSQLIARMEPGLMYPFYDPQSLGGEIGAKASWEGTLELDGSTCDLLLVRYDDDPEDSRWCINRRDRLPRRLEWVENGNGTRLDLTEVVAAEHLRVDDFSFAVPAGYQIEHHEAGPQRGSPVPDFPLQLAEGETVPLVDLSGNVLVFDFWATWCPPCRASLQSLERTATEFSGRPVHFFAVNAMEDLAPGDPLAFIEELALDVDVVLAGDELHSFFAAGNLPALAVVDAEGLAAGVTVGFHGEGSERYVRRLIEAALAADDERRER